ncbi:MAG: DUF6134 family protein [Candidatus Obscuribacterales bacterium]|nr:DUF6134 family protein [Candidatus Obscuribacterales bacterium]
MKKSIKSQSLIVLLIVSAISASLNQSAAIAATQNRHYDVKVDGKPAGSYNLVITSNGDATDVVSDCTVHHKILVFNYDYKYHGHETYKQSQLSTFSGTSNDNGKHFNISLKRSPDNSLSYTINGKGGTASGDTLLSSYWLYPVSEPDKDGFKFFEVDSGRTFKAKLKQLGNDNLTIVGHPTPCRHIELVGGDDGELWYADNRMVRQSSSNLGHKTVIELARID